MASACSPRASGGVEDVATAAVGPPVSVVARRPPRDPSKARMQGRQSEGVWKTIARDSLSRRNGKLHNAPGEARLSRALPVLYGTPRINKFAIQTSLT
jgi:hypothetical protein